MDTPVGRERERAIVLKIYQGVPNVDNDSDNEDNDIIISNKGFFFFCTLFFFFFFLSMILCALNAVTPT